jgi:hypothetical protein
MNIYTNCDNEIEKITSNRDVNYEISNFNYLYFNLNTNLLYIDQKDEGSDYFIKVYIQNINKNLDSIKNNSMDIHISYDIYNMNYLTTNKWTFKFKKQILSLNVCEFCEYIIGIIHNEKFYDNNYSYDYDYIKKDVLKNTIFKFMYLEYFNKYIFEIEIRNNWWVSNSEFKKERDLFLKIKTYIHNCCDENQKLVGI